MDAELGRLFDWLRETDQWEETTIVVCADHGELHGEHDLYGHEFALYDQLINVPLLIKHPELKSDRRDELVELLDCYHTVLETLDVDPDDALETDSDGLTGPIQRDRSCPTSIAPSTGLRSRTLASRRSSRATTAVETTHSSSTHIQ